MDNLKEMTVGDLLQNPTGKGSAVMAMRKVIIQDLDIRFMKLMQNCNNHMEVRCFKSKNEEYMIKVKVPAEKLPNLFYDVLIMLTPECDSKEDSDSIKADRTLNRYRLKLFSNSPNFMFTYTYVLNKNNMIVPKLKNKCSQKALVDPPTIKNPVESYGFEKSCYFACKYIKEKGLLNKAVIDANLYVFDEFKLQASIASQESKLKEYSLVQKAHRSSVKLSKRAKNNTLPTKTTDKQFKKDEKSTPKSTTKTPAKKTTNTTKKKVVKKK